MTVLFSKPRWIMSLLVCLRWSAQAFELRPTATLLPSHSAHLTSSADAAGTLTRYATSYRNNEDRDDAMLRDSSTSGDTDGGTISRQELLRQMHCTATLALLSTTTIVCTATTTTTASFSPALAFEGGVGGLGKTKPETGVVFLSPATQDTTTTAGLVSAELLVAGQALRVEFESPWPLLPTTSGLEVREVQSSESAFLQIVTDPALTMTKKSVKQVLLEEHILSSQGKFGAYGAPTDAKVQAVEEGNTNLWLATFTALTPGLRESDRRVMLKCYPAGNDTWLVLVVGTTLLRFGKQQDTLRKVADSFTVVAAPATRLRETSRSTERRL